MIAKAKSWAKEDREFEETAKAYKKAGRRKTGK